MNTKISHISIIILIVTVLFFFAFVFTTPCSAQFLFPQYPFFPVFNPYYLFPPVPSLSTFSVPILSPTLSPYPVLPTFPRAGAATIITLPTTAPAVTAYAPLGTLNLTPSSLVFLILLLTLPE